MSAQPSRMRRRVLTMGALACARLASARAAAPRDFPWKPVTIIQPYGAGNALDVYARKFATYLPRTLGQPVIVETRPGASGNIAAGFVARAAPDGHTLLVHGVGTLLQSLIPGSNAPDPLKALAPVTLFSEDPMVLTASSSLNVRSVAELVARAKRDSGGLAYGTSGVGGLQHLAMLLFARRAGIELLHVPFPNSTQMYTAMISGEVPLGFAFAGPVDAQYRSGQLVALALSAARRSPLRPDVPTLAESGYPGYDVIGWSGISTTGGTPAATLERIQRAFADALALPEIRDMLTTFGGQPIGSSPPEFAREVAETLTRWAPVMRDLFPAVKS